MAGPTLARRLGRTSTWLVSVAISIIVILAAIVLAVSWGLEKL